MKKRLNLILPALILLFGLISCAVNRTNIFYLGDWTESELDFSESIYFQKENDLLGIITIEKWCCGNTENQDWLRDKENLLTTFNILKELGLKRVLSEEQYRKKLFEDDYWDYDWEGFTLEEVVKKMISTYNHTSDTSDYFYKFWERRKSENNDQVVFQILNEVDQIYNDQKVPLTDNSGTELYQLIKYNIEFNESDSTQKSEVALSYFNYLKKIKLEHSAYNLIFELESTQNLDLNKDSLLRKLSFDTIPEIEYWRTRNDAEWVKTYRDNGP